MAGRDLFEIKKVAEGVHVAVAAAAYKVNCNTAIIETGDGVLVVDSHSKPSAAREILRRLPEVTRKPVRYLVNTHFHWDHWQGNEVYPAAFPDVEIVTSDVTRQAMARKSVKRIQDQLRALPGEIAALPEGEDRRQAETFLAELSALRPALPTLAFEGSLRLGGRGREIHLLHLGRAHTEGDVFVHLPEERIVVTGDCVIGWTPFMGDAHPEDWVRTLDRLERLDFDRMIMGHGEVAGKEWLRFFRGYIEDLIEAVRRAAAGGASLEEIQHRVPDQVAPTYEAALSTYGAFRAWRPRVRGNIERIHSMCG
jgi:glyoxylase-like metal-dependent hydrolase (beta-lactamase superfamily II)